MQTRVEAISANETSNVKTELHQLQQM